MNGRILGMLALALLLFTAAGWAKISVTSPSECISVYPGDTITKAIRISVEDSGWYTVKATGDIDIRPDSWTGYVDEDEPKYVYFTIRAPMDVTDDYFTATFTLYDVNGQYVDDTSMCIHVSRYGEAAAEVTDFIFGAQEYYEEDGYIVVPLYVQNTGDVDMTVDFLADYSDVRFTKTAVFVRAGGEAKVLAKIPSDADLPSSITFYAYGNGVRKEVKVRFTSDTVEQEIELQLPDDIVINKGITYVPVHITNYGETKITVKPKLKDAPFGVSSYADTVTLYPKQTETVNMIVRADNVLQTGDRVARVCLLDDADVELKCKYVALHIPAPEAGEATETVKDGEKLVTITINNGAKHYRNATVDVDVPEGWIVRVEPSDILDIPAYEKEDITVYFKPTEKAEDGLATIVVRAPDGTVLAKKTVSLDKSKLTGYAVMGGNAAAWIIVGLIILAVLVALFSKGGESSSNGSIEELKAQITKK
ncbi:MAG: NPCBM-associated, domain of alpha-galactosidase [Candidatus Diapherotrites archaeon]|nr:NPCBM-associated, domain of alpha-galactosidase [Candidatus Diapherotrites archaeon]MDN5366751.1 NPCBM-associated, domain of alpha-galactosidase [Candidatus Diapherotrites archaeon]